MVGVLTYHLLRIGVVQAYLRVVSILRVGLNNHNRSLLIPSRVEVLLLVVGNLLPGLIRNRRGALVVDRHLLNLRYRGLHLHNQEAVLLPVVGSRHRGLLVLIILTLMA